MKQTGIPRILIAAPCSGSGKTTMVCAFLDALTDLGAADVEQRRFHYGYARWHFSYVAPFSRIDDDGVVAQDVFVVKPFVEGSPVVASYEEGEADVGEVLAQRLQRVPGVGRLGHVELIVACLEFWLVGNGLFCHLEPQFVCQQVGGFFLEWVHGRNQSNPEDCEREQRQICRNSL